MKISYDSEIDALYIRLLEGKHECRSVRLSEEVALNIGAGEKLVGRDSRCQVSSGAGENFGRSPKNMTRKPNTQRRGEGLRRSDEIKRVHVFESEKSNPQRCH